MAWKKQGFPWDLERPLMELRGSLREQGEPLTELGGSHGKLGGSQMELGCPQRKLGGPHKVQLLPSGGLWEKGIERKKWCFLVVVPEVIVPKQ